MTEVFIAGVSMTRFGTTQRQLAVIASKNHANSASNPKCCMHHTYAVEQILNVDMKVHDNFLRYSGRQTTIIKIGVFDNCDSGVVTYETDHEEVGTIEALEMHNGEIYGREHLDFEPRGQR